MKKSIAKLQPFTTDGRIRVVVEAIKGAGAQLRFDSETGLFRLAKILPKGFSFPYDFGFIPGTVADSGDHLAVMVLADAPTAPGCLVESRPIGVVRLLVEGARSDRIISVWPEDALYGKFEDFSELPTQAAIDVERFFRIYPVARGQRVEFLGCDGAEKAVRLIKKNTQGANAKSAASQKKSLHQEPRRQAKSELPHPIISQSLS